MIWDKYQEKVNAIPKEQFNEREYVESQIKDFVGTQAQIDAERIQLKAEAKNKSARIRATYDVAYNIAVGGYMEELYGDYNMPKEVLDIAYAIAYDRGHSAGYAEVEGIFDDMVDSFAKVYDLGLKDGRNGK